MVGVANMRNTILAAVQDGQLASFKCAINADEACVVPGNQKVMRPVEIDGVYLPLVVLQADRT